MWLFCDYEVTACMIEGYVGFVYEIICKVNGKRYIGKKLLTKAATRQVKGKKKKTRVASNWETYYGSNEELKADLEKYGVEQFERRILRFCKTKGECSYYEAREQFMRDVLLSPHYYNTWLSVRVRRSHLIFQ
jgi:hypothetical protein